MSSAIRTLAILAALIGTFSVLTQTAQAAERCAVNWGDGFTYLTSDWGCKYEGDPRIGGVPDGWFADHESGKRNAGEVFEASVVTLRMVSGQQPALYTGTSQTQPTSTQSSGQIEWQCPNWGDKPTNPTADNGCKYDGVKQGGSIPTGWFGQSEFGDKPEGTYLEVTVITLRPTDTSIKVIAQTQNQTTQPSTGTTQIARCPGDGKSVAMAAFALSETDAQSIAQYWQKLGPGEGPCAWKYDANRDGVFIRDATVQSGWSIDWPGMGNGPTQAGGKITSAVLTARFQP